MAKILSFQRIVFMVALAFILSTFQEESRFCATARRSSPCRNPKFNCPENKIPHERERLRKRPKREPQSPFQPRNDPDLVA
uniref:Secreted protein n=1 Tax=Rhipicephalus appendiculatus TaxID=34631 RepID=A0A131YHT8_RHIAP